VRVAKERFKAETNLLALLGIDGQRPSCRGTAGPEWETECPACGADRHFVVKPEDPLGAGAFCRSCRWSGDKIAVAQLVTGMSFSQLVQGYDCEPTPEVLGRLAANQAKREEKAREAAEASAARSKRAAEAWERCSRSLAGAATAYWQGRGVDVVQLEAAGVARGVPPEISSELNSEQLYPTVMPLWDVRGESVRALQFRRVQPFTPPDMTKKEAREDPRCRDRNTFGPVGGCVHASDRGLRGLRNSCPLGTVVVVEGEIDFAIWASRRPDLSVFAIRSGSVTSLGRRLHELGVREVVIRTDRDEPGDRYAAELGRELPFAELLRPVDRDHADDGELLKAGKLPEDPTADCESWSPDQPSSAPKTETPMPKGPRFWSPPAAPAQTPDAELKRLRIAALCEGGPVVLDRRATGVGKSYGSHKEIVGLTVRDGALRAIAVGSHSDADKHAEGLKLHAKGLARRLRQEASLLGQRAKSIRKRGARVVRSLPREEVRGGPRVVAILSRRRRLGARRVRRRITARAVLRAELLEARATEHEELAKRADRLRIGIMPSFDCPLEGEKGEEARRRYTHATGLGWNPIKAACGGCPVRETCSHMADRSHASAADVLVIQHASLAHAAPWQGLLAKAVAVAIDEDPQGQLVESVKFGGPKLDHFERLLEVASDRESELEDVQARLDQAARDQANPPPVRDSPRSLFNQIQAEQSESDAGRRAKRAARARLRSAHRAFDKEAGTVAALAAAQSVVRTLVDEKVNRSAAQALLAPEHVDFNSLLGPGADAAETACQRVWSKVQAELGPKRGVRNLWPVLRELAKSWRDRGFAVLQRRPTQDGNAYTFSITVSAEIPSRVGVLSLDATGRPGLLRRLTRREVEVIEAPPRVELHGLVLADAPRGEGRYHRYPGKLESDLDVIARWLVRVKAERVGVVTFKSQADGVEFGLRRRIAGLEVKTLHYGGGSRGRNDFELWADAVVVLGTRFMPEDAVRDLAATLGATPEELEGGRSFEWRRTAEGVTFKRESWPDGPLREANVMLTTAEQLHAIGRATRGAWTPPSGVLVLGQPPETSHSLRVTTAKREALDERGAQDAEALSRFDTSLPEDLQVSAEGKTPLTGGELVSTALQRRQNSLAREAGSQRALADLLGVSPSQVSRGRIKARDLDRLSMGSSESFSSSVSKGVSSPNSPQSPGASGVTRCQGSYRAIRTLATPKAELSPSAPTSFGELVEERLLSRLIEHHGDAECVGELLGVSASTVMRWGRRQAPRGKRLELLLRLVAEMIAAEFEAADETEGPPVLAEILEFKAFLANWAHEEAMPEPESIHVSMLRGFLEALRRRPRPPPDAA